MTKRRFTPWIALACIGTVAACTSGDGGTAGNTELNVVVPTNAGTPDAVDIQSVEYTINCLGNSDTFLDNNASFADEVTINGNLEVVDGRTDPQGPIPPDFGTPRPGDGAEIWQGFMDLPPGPCTVELRARDNDGEVICTAQEPFSITADTIAKVNLVLICDVSFQAPVGSLDVDGTFSFVVSNFCPDLFVFNAIDTVPQKQPLTIPAGPAAGLTIEIALTSMEVRFRDGDNQCGQSCDPQTCSVNPDGSGLTCTPDPGPVDGVFGTIVCTSTTCIGGNDPGAPCLDDTACVGTPPLVLDGTCSLVQSAFLDCDGDFSPDAGCLVPSNANGEFLGTILPEPNPFVPPNANPLLNATALVACIPPEGLLGGLVPGGESGATIHCWTKVSDGDIDCDKEKHLTILCPGDTACETFAGGAPVQCDETECNIACDDLNSCTSAACTNVGCDQTTAGCCVNDPLVAGTSCPDFGAQPGECDGAGACVAQGCTIDANCGAPDQCSGQPLCVGFVCQAAPPINEGLDCDAGGGATSGTCTSGSCDANNECLVDADCTLGGDDCNDPSCNTTPIPNVCTTVPANEGGACDAGGGPGSGQCGSGICGPLPPAPASATVLNSCGLPPGVSTNLVPFPAGLAVVPSTAVVDGSAFTADVTPTIDLDQAFLEGAAVTVFTLFGAFLTEASIVVSQTEVNIPSGCTTTNETLYVDNGLPLTCISLIPSENGWPCAGPAGSACGAIGTCTANAGLPYNVVIPNDPYACTTTADCTDVQGSTGASDCCTAPGAPNAGCVAAGECDPTQVPTQITGAVTLDTFGTQTMTCPVVDTSPGTLAICTSGVRADPVGPLDAPSETWFFVQIGALAVVFDCELGSPNNPPDCVTDADCAGTVCDGGTDEPLPYTPCLVDGDCPNGACIPNACDLTASAPPILDTCFGPRATTTPTDPTGDVCTSSNDNGGAACNSNADCDLPCDLNTNTCENSPGTACDNTTLVGAAACQGTGGGTCIAACVQYPILP